MNELIEHYMARYLMMMTTTSQDTFRRAIKRFLCQIPEADALKPSKIQALNFIKTLTETEGIQGKLSLKTIQKEVNCVRGFYAFLKRLEVAENIFEGPEFKFKSRHTPERRPINCIPFESIENIIKRPTPWTKQGCRDRAILATFFATGIRRAELIKISIGDIKFSHVGTPFILIHGKGNKKREQALSMEAYRFISPLRRQRLDDKAKKSDPLFCSYQCNGLPDNQFLNPKTVYKIFKTYAKNFSPHSARVTAITKLIADGVPLPEVQNFSGHADIQMVVHYNKQALNVENHAGKKNFFNLKV